MEIPLHDQASPPARDLPAHVVISTEPHRLSTPVGMHANRSQHVVKPHCIVRRATPQPDASPASAQAHRFDVLPAACAFGSTPLTKLGSCHRPIAAQNAAL